MKHLRLMILIGLSAMPFTSNSARSNDLGELFSKVKPETATVPDVEIFGWIERNGSESVARISLTPDPGTKLVANPGVTVTPIDDYGQWLDYDDVYVGLDDTTYFASTPTIDIGRVKENGQPIQADVSYAYCVVDDICLFGEKRIEIQTRLPN